MKHVLEGQKLFPIIAWTLVIAGTFFVLKLSLALQNTGDSLGSKTTQTKAALEADIPTYDP